MSNKNNIEIQKNTEHKTHIFYKIKRYEVHSLPFNVGIAKF